MYWEWQEARLIELQKLEKEQIFISSEITGLKKNIKEKFKGHLDKDWLYFKQNINFLFFSLRNFLKGYKKKKYKWLIYSFLLYNIFNYFKILTKVTTQFMAILFTIASILIKFFV